LYLLIKSTTSCGGQKFLFGLFTKPSNVIKFDFGDMIFNFFTDFKNTKASHYKQIMASPKSGLKLTVLIRFCKAIA